MGIKKTILIIFFIILLLFGYAILNMNYNKDAVKITLDQPITKEQFNFINERLYIKDYAINYSKNYKNKEIIMTDGNNLDIKNIDLVKGDFLYSTDKKIAVIGDDIAEKNYSFSNITGKEINVFDENYEIIGIIKDNNNIYIPYDEKKLNEYWDEVSISYVPVNQEETDFFIRDVEVLLKTIGINVIDTIIYKDNIDSFLNIIILLSIFIIIKLSIYLYLKIKKNIKTLTAYYNQNKRREYFHKFIYIKRKPISLLILKLIVFISIIYIAIFSLRYLTIPNSLIPSNLFSLLSYRDVILRIYEKFLYYMQSGFISIWIDTIKLYGIIFVIFIIINILVTILIRDVKE
ncbi:ABC transporter permease [Senegalia massiliensis]|uniref:ABC transporter permease n=1 Tax=Senegalia massiliensis TaxID=1720316 RepID=UPI00103248D7|nr:ABC transporter permease [Senegalia massiliensis]